MAQDRAYELYLRDISKYERITPKREAELSRIIIRGRSKKKIEAAVEEMAQANLRLVLHCLKEFTGFLTMSDVSISRMDLIAEGNIALVNAARKFNAEFRSIRNEKKKPTRVKFSTYACKSIKCAMRRAIRLSKFIHIPENHFGYWAKINALKQQYDGVTDDVVMDQLEITSSKLDKLKTSRESRTAKLEDFTMDDGVSHWSDIMPDTTAPDPEGATSRKDLRRHLLREMGALPDRTRKMLFATFLSNKMATLGDLSKRFGVSKERCRQICARGLQILRQRLEDRWGHTGDLEAFGLCLQTVAAGDISPVQSRNLDVTTFDARTTAGYTYANEEAACVA